MKHSKNKFPGFSAISQEIFKLIHLSLVSFSRPAALAGADWFVPPLQLVGMSRNSTYLVCVTTHKPTHKPTRIDCESVSNNIDKRQKRRTKHNSTRETYVTRDSRGKEVFTGISSSPILKFQVTVYLLKKL